MNSTEAPDSGDKSSSPAPHELSRGERFTLALDKANAAIVSGLADMTANAATVQEIWAARETLCEKFVDSLEDPGKRPRVQFDLMIDKAYIFKEVDDIARYLRELDTAEGFALSQRLDDDDTSIAKIAEELDKYIDGLDSSIDTLILKLRPHIRYEDRELLRRLSIEGADEKCLQDAIYDMIRQEGSDPDQVMASIGVSRV